jgi:hypothetical protein
VTTRAPGVRRRTNSSGGKDVIVTYSGLLNGDDGAWFSEPGAILRSISYSGVWGAGGSAQLNCCGSSAIAPANPLTGAQLDESIIGAVASANQTVTANLYTAAPSYRPKVTAGDVTTSLKIVAYFVQD